VPSAVTGLMADSRRDSPDRHGAGLHRMLGHILECQFVDLAEFDTGTLRSDECEGCHGDQRHGRGSAGVF
jgi:hypothetical protein